ncbi:hypothetical protein ACFPZL_04115 [Leucobacter soli]|uniref:Uncharacterized protein n=1 Tax=Leucobacter soli TaxID=2812850 RepID=A0A916NG27_9MICO|nr:hypothetical protein [Leucobacter soli]CAG7604228.1 hypothetical protein LEUCIP111803_00716 [Leucobacter soli]
MSTEPTNTEPMSTKQTNTEPMSTEPTATDPTYTAPLNAEAMNDAVRTGPTADGAEPAPDRRPWPRTGPIVWGAIVLAVCFYSAMQLVAPGSVDSTTVVIVCLIALGLLLLGVSVAVLVRNARDRR